MALLFAEMDAAVAQVTSILGADGPEPSAFSRADIEDALQYYYLNVEKSVDWLLCKQASWCALVNSLSFGH
jgi:hypothetical protein